MVNPIFTVGVVNINMSDKKYIIHPKSIYLLEDMFNNYEGLDIVEKAKRMLNKPTTYHIGDINNIPVYVSEDIPENELYIIDKPEGFSGTFTAPIFKFNE